MDIGDLSTRSACSSKVDEKCVHVRGHHSVAECLKDTLINQILIATVENLS